MKNKKSEPLRGKPSISSPDAWGWRSEWPFLLSIFTALMALYIATMPRTVTMEDSGLFISTAYTAGIAHPPGYPLYTMIAKLFTLMPWGSIAFRVHLVSAFSAAGACCFVYLCSLMATRRREASILAALVYGVSLTLWSQAIIAEVYALNALFFFSLLAMCMKLAYDFRARRLYAAAFIFGLSLTNHWPLMILASGAFVIILYDKIRMFMKHLPLTAVCFTAGLLPYLYLIIASSFEPYITAVMPIHTIKNLWWCVTRSGYAALDTTPAADVFDYLSFIRLFAVSLVKEFSVFGFVAFITGAVFLWRMSARKIFWAFFAAFISSSIVLKLFQRSEFDHVTRDMYLVWQLIPFGIASICISFTILGLDRLRFLSHIQKKTALLVIGALIIAGAFISNSRENNLHHDTFGYDYARLVLESLPENAILFVDGAADLGPYAYTNIVTGFRKDVTLYTQSGFLFSNRLYFPGTDTKTMNARLEEFLIKHRTIFAPSIRSGLEDDLEKNNHVVHNGLYYRISKDQDTSLKTPGLVAAVQAFLNRQLEGRYSSKWLAHRRLILSRMCKFLMQNGTTHPIFTQNDTCKLFYAENLYKRKDFTAAYPLLVELIENTPFAYFSTAEWYTIHLYHLFIHIQLINQQPGDAALKQSRYQELIDTVYRAAAFQTACNNQIVDYLLQIHSQIPVNIRLPWLRKKFSHCDKLRIAIDGAIDLQHRREKGDRS